MTVQRRKRADKAKKETVRELLNRLRQGVLQPRFCSYTDTEGTIEFGKLCHIFRAVSEADRLEIALCVEELHGENAFRAKKWVEDGDEEAGIAYRYPPTLVVSLE